ncbi:NAC domain-containing protein 14-like [Argentina anserina]|uniref:NAC domain-containing protein 14-like n=1 Tax=Argentina anserina TaxID=57926 RepID=UPI002176948B|nr:NAC domain-containing protein 14-like [Potentilla anserina]
MEGCMILPGQRFDPMEEELLLCYLKPKVNGQEVPGNDSLICDFDLYGDKEPWQIWEMFQSKHTYDLRKRRDMYFFTQKKKMRATASRSCRKVWAGSWKGQIRAQHIYLLDQNLSPTSTLLGFKKTYTYTYPKNSSVRHGSWTMYEYELDKSQLLPNKQADYVLCLLRNHDGLKRKRIQVEEVVEEACAEQDDGGSHLSDPALAVDDKRRCLKPSSHDNVAAAAAPSFEWTDVQHWYEQPPLSTSTAEPCVANVQLVVESQVSKENLDQQCNDIETNALTQMGEGNGVMTPLIEASGPKLTNATDWIESFMDIPLPNDEMLSSMEVGWMVPELKAAIESDEDCHDLRGSTKDAGLL